MSSENKTDETKPKDRRQSLFFTYSSDNSFKDLTKVDDEEEEEEVEEWR